MLNPVLNINKAFRKKVQINLALTFDSKTMIPIKKVLRKDNNCVISLMMFYENIKIKILKVLSSVIYCIMENYVCADYLCCLQN